MKLFVADYDGTFFRHDAEEVKRNVEMVAKWREAGNVFAFATGRDVVNMKFEYDRFNVEYDYLVGVNGAFVVDKELNVLFKQTIPNDIASEIIDMLRDDSEGQLLVQNGIDGCYKVNYKEDDHIKALHAKTTALYKHTAEEALKEEVISVGCMTDHFDVAKRLNDLVIEKFGDQVTSFNNLNYVNVVPKDISKATGIQLIADKYDIKSQDINVIGDNLNDLEMIETFNGVTLENGKDEVKAKAEKIVDCVASYMQECMAA